VYVRLLNFIQECGDNPSVSLMIIVVTLLFNVIMSMAIHAILKEALAQGYMGVVYMMLSILAVGIFVKRVETLWGADRMFEKLER
jgi:hypothetical protein